MLLRRFGLVGALLSSIVLSSCVTDSSTIFISSAVKVDTGSCLLDANGDALVSTSADVGAATDGIMVGFVVNNLIRQRNFSIATDVSGVLITEAEVELTDIAGNPVAATFTYPATGYVPGSTDGVTPGKGVTLIPVVPAAYMSQFAGITTTTTIVAQITLRGRTNGNLKVEGGKFGWLINLLPAGSSLVDCSATGGVACCFAGQDGELVCGDSANLGLCAPKQ